MNALTARAQRVSLLQVRARQTCFPAGSDAALVCDRPLPRRIAGLGLLLELGTPLDLQEAGSARKRPSTYVRASHSWSTARTSSAAD